MLKVETNRYYHHTMLCEMLYTVYSIHSNVRDERLKEREGGLRTVYVCTVLTYYVQCTRTYTQLVLF